MAKRKIQEMPETVLTYGRNIWLGQTVIFQDFMTTLCFVICVNLHSAEYKRHLCVLKYNESLQQVSAPICLPDLANQSCRTSVKDKLPNLDPSH